MNSTSREPGRLIWAFWGAAGLAALGGLMPVLLTGVGGRLTGVAIPFAVGAIGFAACAVLHEQGRVTTSVIYFVAGLVIVFGLLSMFSLPLRLAVLGTCPAVPAPCTSGLPRPLTDAENTAMGLAAVLGILSVFVAFVGLAVLYRRPALPAYTPPERRIAPIPPRPAAASSAPAEPKVEEAPAAQSEPEATGEPEPESSPPTS